MDFNIKIKQHGHEILLYDSYNPKHLYVAFREINKNYLFYLTENATKKTVFFIIYQDSSNSIIFKM